MNNVFAGLLVVAVVAGAFYLGTQYEWNDEQGAAENIGSAIDEGVNDVGRAIEDAVD